MALAILYAEPHRAISRPTSAGPGNSRRNTARRALLSRMPVRRQRSLRHAAAEAEMVAPHTDSDNCRCGVQRNSHAGTDAALRSVGLAACRTRPCVAQAMHLAFWHRVIIPVVWWARDRGIVVMNTTAFDGQWTRKVIEWLGFGTAQGSSSRGGLRGLAVMAKRLGEGKDCAFTIDGPRGPRYIAKPGPVMLARKTGCPVVVFHIGVDRGKTFEKTWDHFLMPKPFARTVMLFAPPIYVPADARCAELEAKHAEMQRELERVRDIAESGSRSPKKPARRTGQSFRNRYPIPPPVFFRRVRKSFYSRHLTDEWIFGSAQT